MRPVRRGPSPQQFDFYNYRDAFKDLVSRLGPYCSYCERLIPTNLAIEHIQPKALPRYAGLEGRWENFLLACVNCNSTKKNKDVILPDHLIPDRDNTFVAFSYLPDGTVKPSTALSKTARQQAKTTLALVGLDRKIARTRDANGKFIAVNRVEQRMAAWAKAEDARADIAANPSVIALRKMAANLAAATGFFSIWMEVFAHDAEMRNRLIEVFSGTASTSSTGARGSGCFDPTTTAPVHPAPNPDGLPHGGKT